MESRKLLPLLAGLCALPATALDISGFTWNKLGQPLGFTKVCIIGTTTCVNSALSNGAFHISGSAPVRLRAPDASGFALALRGRRMSLRSPEALKASLAWYDATGRALARSGDVTLIAGANDLEIPSGAGGPGLRFLRLDAGTFSATWKVLLGGSAIPAQGPQASIASLPKTAASYPGIEASRTGYRTQRYYPQQDPDTTFILLQAVSDSGFAIANKDHYQVTKLDAKDAFSQFVVAGCDSTGALVKDTVTDSLHYAYRDGKMYFYYDNLCFGAVMSGTGSDIHGTWTYQSMAPLPADVRPAACGPDPLVPPESPNLLLHRFTFTDTDLFEEVTGESCPADYWLDILMPGFLSADTAVTLTKNTCREAVFRNKAAESATLAFTLAADTMTASFAYKATTCTVKAGIQADPNPDCASDPQGDFLDCIANSGFVIFPPAGPKISAAAPLRPAGVAPRWGQSRDLGRRSGFAPSRHGPAISLYFPQWSLIPR